VEALRQGLGELGYAEGQGIAIEWRFAEGQPERLMGLAMELAQLGVDVIVTGAGDANGPAKQATGTIPIVMTVSADPVGEGLVASLAHPGSNVTGLSALASPLGAKRLQLLQEALPGIERVAVLRVMREGSQGSQFSAVEIAARELGIELLPIDVGSADEWEGAS